MKNKKLFIIGAVVVVIAIAVIIASKYYPPAQNADSSGTIGVVKKYNAGQMSEKDVKLKNLMLKDVASVKSAIDQLKEYKSFINDLAKDLGNWNKSIETSKAKKASGLKDEKILTENAALYTEYKTYIDKNIGVLDNTIELLTKFTQKDTSNLNLNIMAQLNDYENFRIQIAQKFESMVAQLPKVHNAFVKNGMKGIIGNKDNTLGYVVAGKENFNSSSVINYNITLGVYYVYNKDVQGNVTTYNKDAQGNVTTYNKDVQGNVTTYNKDVQGNVTTYNKDVQGNVTAFNKEVQGVAAALNKENQGATIRQNKDGSLGSAQLGTNVIGVFAFMMKDGSLNAVLNKDNSLNCAMNKDNTLGCCLNKEMNYVIFTNKDSQLGSLFTNKQLGFVDPVE